MRRRVRMNLKRAEVFFEKMVRGVMRDESLNEISISLNRRLHGNVFTPKRTSIWYVPNAAMMRGYISAHQTPILARYNPDYLNHMIKHGLLSHGSIRQHTHIDIINDKVLFFIPARDTVKTKVTKAGVVHVYNMGPIHERRKSILKSTIVFAWQDILKRIGRVYVKHAEM